ncbi:MAG: hypothetical protein IJU51_06805 [Clostridia bacterium]|nr:hypothetical protein [Clostridia bacterium]
MDPALISALVAFAGSLTGTLAGIITSSKLTDYRLKELEKRVDKHNSLVERMYCLEEKINLQEEKQRNADHRITILEEDKK